MDSILQDLRYAVRTLAKAPTFTITAIVTLALGIGASTAIFSLIDAALVKPLPFPAAGQLVAMPGVQTRFRDQPSTWAMDVVDWRKQTQIFRSVAEYGLGEMSLSGIGGAPVRMRVGMVTPDFFPTLGVPAHLGRTFQNAEGRPGAGDVVVLSDGLWRRQFGSDPSVLNRAIQLNGRPHIVVGIMPRGFEFPGRADAWIPFAIPWDPSHADIFAFVIDEHAIGRLRAGLSVAEARVLAADVSRQYRLSHPRANAHYESILEPLRDDLLADRTSIYLILVATVGVVLLIASANVAGLSIARAAAREHDVAVRRALGASHWRLGSQLLAESFVLAAAGALLGLLALPWTFHGLEALLPDGLLGLVAPTVDWRVAVVTGAVVCGVTALCGLSPLVSTIRMEVARPLHQAGRHIARGAAGLRRVLVAGELALALTLIIGGAALLQSLFRLTRLDLGIRPDHVLTADLSLSRADYPTAALQRAFFANLLSRLNGLAVVHSAGLGSAPPWAGDIVTIAGVTTRRDSSSHHSPALHLVATPGYLSALGIPVLAGRDFTEADNSDSPDVAIVTRSLADSLGLGAAALGRQIWIDAFRDTAPSTIVGIAGDVKYDASFDKTLPQVYRPFAQERDLPSLHAALVVETRLDPVSFVTALRGTIRTLDPALPVDRVHTMTELVASSRARETDTTMALVAFAGLALLLAAFGLHGVLAYVATRRTREIAVRVALGANRRDIYALVFREGLGPVAAGVALGSAGALVSTRVIAHYVYGISLVGPQVFATGAVILGLVAVTACLLPARRAAAVDPMVALRAE